MKPTSVAQAGCHQRLTPLTQRAKASARAPSCNHRSISSSEAAPQVFRLLSPCGLAVGYPHAKARCRRARRVSRRRGTLGCPKQRLHLSCALEQSVDLTPEDALESGVPLRGLVLAGQLVDPNVVCP
eukprot:UN2671